MLNVTFDLVWERPVGGNGFAWNDAGAVHDLERRLVRVEGVPFTNYKPLTECTGLFRTFADLSLTPVAVLDFVNRYGHPSYRAGHSAATGKTAILPFDAGAIFDDLSGWKGMIGRMKSLVGVWDALCQTDWRALRTLLGRYQSKRFHLPASASHGELAGAAVTLLYHEVGAMTFGSLLGLTDRPDADYVQWHEQGKGLLLKLIPQSLWHAMYLQFAWAILGNKSYQRCDGCGKWFELSPSVNRADRQTCSDSCRVKLYRQRQKRARQLSAKGMNVQKIAKEIGSDVATIKTWIKKRKG
jgi:hypothetical protein